MKKRLSVILTLCLLLFSISPTFAFSYEAKSETLAATDSVKLVPVKFGDSDFDNRVSIKDATLIQKHVAGLITLTEDQLLLSDVDGNTRVNIVDATWVQKKVASIVDIFPVEENKPEETTTTEPIEPTVPTTQTTATEPVEPTIPTTQTTATEPVEPTVPTTQTTATEPVEPTAPTTQTTATEPVEPTAPTTQTTATEPVEPTTPSVETTIPKPEEPTKPSKPEPPERPSKPENYKPIDTIDGDSISTETLWKIEEGFLRLVNEERASKGLNPISHNKALDDAAQVRSAELIISYSHTRPNGEKYSTAIDKDLYRYAIVGENVYAVYGTHTGKKEYICNDEQVEYIYTKFFNDFKNSPTHYENMMYEEFKDTGIGITYIWNDEVGLPCFYISHIFGVTR